MDPIHFTAARHIARHRTSAAEEIDAFYEDHAFAGVHDVRRCVVQLAQRLRAAAGAARAKARTRIAMRGDSTKCRNAVG